MGQDGAPGILGLRGDIGDTPPLEGLKVKIMLVFLHCEKKFLYTQLQPIILKDGVKFYWPIP